MDDGTKNLIIRGAIAAVLLVVVFFFLNATVGEAFRFGKSNSFRFQSASKVASSDFGSSPFMQHFTGEGTVHYIGEITDLFYFDSLCRGEVCTEENGFFKRDSVWQDAGVAPTVAVGPPGEDLDALSGLDAIKCSNVDLVDASLIDTSKIYWGVSISAKGCTLNQEGFKTLQPHYTTNLNSVYSKCVRSNCDVIWQDNKNKLVLIGTFK